jgi:hypothetical protein
MNESLRLVDITQSIADVLWNWSSLQPTDAPGPGLNALGLSKRTDSSVYAGVVL